MSAPLVFSSRQIQTKAMASTYSFTKEDVALHFHSQEKKNEGMTRDAYTQSNTLHCLSSSNPSTTLTPSIIDISTNEDSINSDDNKRKSEEEVEMKDKEKWETRKETVRVVHVYKKKDEQLCRKSGCFSWIRKKKSKERESQRRDNSIFSH
ncbi:hypothetical protein P8452_56430 [Trifolium repens]|nr:hypothetical protein P8452_56430 [Trifolium repens]